MDKILELLKVLNDDDNYKKSKLNDENCKIIIEKNGEEVKQKLVGNPILLIVVLQYNVKRIQEQIGLSDKELNKLLENIKVVEGSDTND